MLDGLTSKLGDVIRQVSGKTHITEKNIQDAVREIKVALLEADVNLRVVRRFVNRTTEEALGARVLRDVSPGQQFTRIVHERMTALLGGERADLVLKGPDTLSVILLVGLQGSGKTTTAAKLARHLSGQGRKPLLIAADRVRPAAIEQLQQLGAALDLPVFTGDPTGGAVAVATVRDGLRHARGGGSADVVIVDSAGRLQADNALMDELREINREASPQETLLVADAMTGQTAVEVAGEFDRQVGLSGIILSKFDSDTRGGAALSIREITGKPIKFVGTGESNDALEPFHPDRVASRILGMGDVVSLVEQAQETFDQERAERLVRKMRRRTFTMADYLEQLSELRKMGSLTSLVEKLPGMQAAVASGAVNEKGLRREEAIMLSMTPGERSNPRILGPSRRKRVARGSGTSVSEVNRLVRKFEKMSLAMKKMTKNKKLQQQFLAQMGG
ncbi:MAG: signal recognition particle protein [Spirochaetaceae bacterium]|nr:signal recognition particle protein [Spirochaetaceae bacterium]